MKLTRVFPSYFGSRGYDSSGFQEWQLPKYLEENLGVQWVAPELAQEVWLFDFSWSGMLAAFRVPKSHRKLFVFEPRAVNPVQHRAAVQALFGQVFVFSCSQSQPTNTYLEGEGFRGIGAEIQDVSIVRRIGAAFGNKQSVVPGSLYWLRVDAMVELLRRGYEVTLAGPGWDNSPARFLRQLVRTLLDSVLAMQLPDLKLLRPLPLKTLSKFENFQLRGWVDNEVAFFKEFDMLLIVENDLDFLSEKPFGAIASGVPFVYVGPEEFANYSPPGAPFSSEASAISVADTVQKLTTRISHGDFPIETLESRFPQSFYSRLLIEIRTFRSVSNCTSA